MSVSAITRFVTAEGQYRFSLLQSWQDNFGQLSSKISSLPALDGGLDEYGSARAPKQVGKLDLTIGLRAQSAAEATQKTDELLKLVTWGKGRLYMQPADPNAEERWTNARLVNLPRVLNLNAHNDYSRRLSLSFEADYPYWFTQGTWPWSWGDGTKWGTNIWGGSALPVACAGLQSDFSLNRLGTAAVNPQIIIRCGAGQSATNLRLQRLAGGIKVLDEIQWNSTLNAGDELIVDAWRWQVKLNGLNAYNSNFAASRLRFMELLPGNNELRLMLQNPSDACSVTIRYFELWN